ncbi:MAG: septum formation family protein [Chloroflexi bacterium]|nr:septum formation family protein [Chloroflexota bacterium]
MTQPSARSLPGPLAAIVGAVRAHPRLTFALAVILAGLAVMRLITPPLADVRDAVEGDCFAGSPLTISANVAGAVHVVPGFATGIQRVQCSEPHVWESLGLATLPGVAGAPYPVNDIESLVSDVCAARFASFIGRPLAGSELSVTAFYPIRDDWETKDERRVACLVVEPGRGPVTGSLRGANR